jgi:hypothetical protein
LLRLCNDRPLHKKEMKNEKQRKPLPIPIPHSL